MRPQRQKSGESGHVCAVEGEQPENGVNDRDDVRRESRECRGARSSADVMCVLCPVNCVSRRIAAPRATGTRGTGLGARRVRDRVRRRPPDGRRPAGPRAGVRESWVSSRVCPCCRAKNDDFHGSHTFTPSRAQPFTSRGHAHTLATEYLRHATPTAISRERHARPRDAARHRAATSTWWSRHDARRAHGAAHATHVSTSHTLEQQIHIVVWRGDSVHRHASRRGPAPQPGTATLASSLHTKCSRRQPKRRCSLLTSPHIRQAIGLHRPEQKLLVALPSCTMRPSSLTVNSSVLQSGVALGEATAHGTDMNVELPMPRDTHEPPPDAQPMIMQQQQTSKKSV